jgi:transcriptional regulator with XRE-family HTH domain
LGFSQAKFATRIAISSSYVADIENYKKIASERVIRLIIAEFKISDEWLRKGNGEMFAEEMDADLSRIVSIFNSLSPPFKECAMRQMGELSTLSEQRLEEFIPHYRRGSAMLLQ